MNEQAERNPRYELAAVGALVAIFVAIAIMVFSVLSDPKAEDTLAEFLTAWKVGEYQTAAELTTGKPEEVAAALEANVDGLDGAELDGTIESVDEQGDEARASVRMIWEVPEIGRFAYSNGAIRMEQSGGEWRVTWRERVVHPELEQSGERLGTTVDAAERAPITDRDGRALVTQRPAVEVGVIPAELDDRRAAVDAIAAATEADPKALMRSIRAAEPENFVPAITMRQGDFARVEDELRSIPGVDIGERELPLAPTREFARALLGSVGPVTAEQIEESEGELEIGDQVGQGGLQAAFEDQLAGTPDRSIVIRDAEGAPVKTLETVEGEDGDPLQTTLDRAVQSAAEQALGDVEGNAALVALEPATGDILAVANRPVEDGFNRALAGQYPPGSTFKVISTAALLASGLNPDSTVDCPTTANVGGRDFVNFEGSAAGAVPFSTDFAESCNTAFVSLADRLEPRDLSRTARDFGFGRDYELGVETFSGRVPRARDETEQAASMIGQARILASPLAMAGVAAAVADGRWRLPRLLADDPSDEGPDLEDAETLRTLMRSVVTSGTGIALAAVPDEPIGKSGTAEYGSGDPPPTHAWFIAAREDVAAAVLVEDAPSGGESAAPIAAEFLTELSLAE